MNNLEYLNQISKTSRPVKTGANANGFGTIIKIAVIGVVAFIVLMILGLVIGKKADSSSNLGAQIYTRTTNLEKTVTTYNKSLRSSKLRSIGLTLSSTLTAALNQMDEPLKSQASKDKEVTASESEYSANLDQILTSAKLNGMLDRTYANQMQLQTALLLSLLEQAINHTKDENLKGIYIQYQSNLATANADFTNYSSSSD